MGEGRAAKLGRFEAALFDFVLSSLKLSERDKRVYYQRFLREIKTYSIIRRRKKEPRNKGCVLELEGIDNMNIYNPKEFARFFKENWHLRYQKETSRREIESFLANLSKYFL